MVDKIGELEVSVSIADRVVKVASGATKVEMEGLATDCTGPGIFFDETSDVSTSSCNLVMSLLTITN